MTKLLVSAATLALFAVPQIAAAQALPAVTIGYVDVARVTNECTACKAASATITSQANSLKARETALTNPLATEQQAIQTAINALKGADPDAALEARVKAFDTKRQNAASELTRGQETVQRNVAYVNQQIGSKLGPILQQVRTKRGIGVLLDASTMLSADPRLDVTADVIAALNAALPSVSTTAPAAPAPKQTR